MSYLFCFMSVNSKIFDIEIRVKAEIHNTIIKIMQYVEASKKHVHVRVRT